MLFVGVVVVVNLAISTEGGPLLPNSVQKFTACLIHSGAFLQGINLFFSAFVELSGKFTTDMNKKN